MTSSKKHNVPSKAEGNSGEFVKPIIRSAYDGTRVEVPAKTGESMTHQSFKDECDINRIIARYAATGEFPGQNGNPRYLTVPANADFTTQQQMAAIARSLWEELPDARRAEYGSIEAFLQDPFGDPIQEPVEAPPAGSEVTNETPEPAEPIDST
jgi:hypothetical protein